MDERHLDDRGGPTMNRRQREDELRAMLTTQRGKEELLATLKKQAGIQGGNLPPFGSLLVAAILNYEYPSEPEREAGTTESPPDPSLEKTEPGDVKFSEPPGREAPGG